MLMKLMRKLYRAAELENIRVFLALLEPDSSARVLDLGCGEGSLTLEIGEKVGTTQLLGVDINDESVQHCQASGIKAFRHDLDDPLPFDNESFDVVCASQIFEHLSHTDLFIREVHRVLKQDGYAVISTPNLAVWHNIIYIFLGWQLFWTGISDEVTVGNPLQFRYKQTTSEGLRFSHRRVLTYRGLKELFQYHRFKIEKLSGVGYHPFPVKIAKVLSRLDPRHSLFLTMKVKKPKEW